MGALTLPIATLAFATLSGDLRNDGTAFFNLMRNMGGAVGVAIVSSRLVELTQIHHGYLVEFIPPFRHILMPSGNHAEAAMKLLNLGLTQQAAMIAYINGYLLLGILTIVMLPLVFLLKVPRGPAAAGQPAVVHD